jgi:hypothetical protein
LLLPVARRESFLNEPLSFRDDTLFGRLVKREDGVDMPKISSPIELCRVITEHLIVAGTTSSGQVMGRRERSEQPSVFLNNCPPLGSVIFSLTEFDFILQAAIHEREMPRRENQTKIDLNRDRSSWIGGGEILVLWLRISSTVLTFSQGHHIQEVPWGSLRKYPLPRAIGSDMTSFSELTSEINVSIVKDRELAGKGFNLVIDGMVLPEALEDILRGVTHGTHVTTQGMNRNNTEGGVRTGDRICGGHSCEGRRGGRGKRMANHISIWFDLSNIPHQQISQSGILESCASL